LIPKLSGDFKMTFIKLSAFAVFFFSFSMAAHAESGYVNAGAGYANAVYSCQQIHDEFPRNYISTGEWATVIKKFTCQDGTYYVVDDTDSVFTVKSENLFFKHRSAKVSANGTAGLVNDGAGYSNASYGCPQIHREFPKGSIPASTRVKVLQSFQCNDALYYVVSTGGLPFTVRSDNFNPAK
jgi:hypothetical protein